MERNENFEYLLDSNVVPNTVEAASIQEKISMYAEKIGEYQEKVAEYKRYLTETQIQLDALEKQKRRHCAVLSPLRRMPLEILGAIFLLVPPGYRDHDGRPKVVVLGRVCKRWREATLYTNRLWCSISLGRRNGAKVFDKAVSWLQRSGKTPKSLEFDRYGRDGRCPCRFDGNPCVTEDDALTRLLKQGPTLDHFTLTVSSTRCFRKWIGAIHSPDTSSVRPWDALRSFDLTFGDDEMGELWDERETDTQSQSIFSLLPPAITAFHLYLPDTSTAFDKRLEESSSRHASISIPANVLNKLTTFTIQCQWARSKLFPLLRQCFNVETLTIELGCHSLGERDATFLQNLGAFPIILPNVSSLHLSGTRRVQADILEYLTTPALRSLDICLYDSDVSKCKVFEQIINKFLEASSAKDNLLDFTVSRGHISGEDLRSCLTGLHHLKRLTLDKVIWSDELFAFEAGAIQPHLPSVEDFQLLEIDRFVTTPKLGLKALMENPRVGCSPCIMTISCTDNSWNPFGESEVALLREKAGMFLRKIPRY